MREMKDSGVRWLGDIPCCWKVMRVKHGFFRKKEEAHQDSPVVLSLARAGVRERDISNNEGQIAESYYNYNPVDVDDLLINPMDLYSGANCSISKIQGVISQAYINLRYKPGFDPKYYDYYFKIQYWMMAFFAHGKGVSFENRWTLNAETLMNYPIIVPSLDEQKRIADYLDSKCSKIDEIIAKQEQIIEKLKEYRLSVITESVTKGLNPDILKKDSGISWMGEIPSHWKLPKIKYIASISSGGTPDRNVPEYWNGDINWVKTGELQNTYLFDTEEKITELALNSSSAKVFPEDTILMAMYGQGKTRGMTALLKTPSTTNQACAGITVNNKTMSTQYLWTCLMGAYNAIREKALGSGQPNLSGALIGDFTVTMPPLDEQEAICVYIEKRIPIIDESIMKIEKMLDLLGDYKKSLIYEVVTGKKEV